MFMSYPCRWICYVAMLMGICFGGIGIEDLHAAPGDLKFEAQLIWGTDKAAPKSKDIKDPDPKILEKLKGVFKWKNYYEIDHKDLTVPKTGRSKVKMSSKCELEIAWLAENKVEVVLIGEGKPVLTKKQSIIPGELMVLAGDSLDATAWFVILTPVKSSE